MLLGYIWLLGTFVNSSCDIKINLNIVQNCCRNLAVRGLRIKKFINIETSLYEPVLFDKSLGIYLECSENYDVHIDD